jgi:eukaryotic-like serine/threonine-protein kinase
MSGTEAGDIVDGRYRILSRLGAGGMADVFLAEDEQLGRQVALKLLHRRFSADPGFVERFRREAQAAASLQHPNVVSVFDRGAYDDTYYIAMEYLPGRTLKQLIREEAPLDPIRAIDLTIQILKAARFAHRRGVIHRDLKPHNVIVDDNDHAKVTDFGIARAGASDMTETGSIMGTAQYLSPEQAQGQAVGESSDLYSIGIVLYEMLTARLPFDAESAVTIALKHVSEAPVPPAQLNPAVPASLNQAVMWSLNKNPADRPADADQFITVLEGIREQISTGRTGEATASMAAVSAGLAGGFVGAGLGAGGGAPGTGPLPTTMMPATGAYGAGATYDGERLDTPYGPPPNPSDGGSGGSGGSKAWPWVLVAVLVLALIGGGIAFILTRPQKATVPTVVNLSQSVAQAKVNDAGFSVSVINVASGTPQGTVIDQNPLGGARASQSSTVTLTVSSGPGNVNVPSVIDLSEKRAVTAIKHAGLKVARILGQQSNQVQMGNATGTDPSAGQSLAAGTGVTLYISSGASPVAVPDVTNDNVNTATSALTGAGFKVTVSNQTSTTAQSGTVISQTPAGNSNAKSGSTVTITVATAPTTASVPNVIGDSSSAATSQLRSAGFKVYKQTQDVTDPSKSGQVVSQTPTGSTTANKGSSVTIVVGKYVGSSTGTTTTTTNTTATNTTTTPTNTTATGTTTTSSTA